eukprot:1161859-Pelagomonas_calceolata.AAC.21
MGNITRTSMIAVPDQSKRTAQCAQPIPKQRPTLTLVNSSDLTEYDPSAAPCMEARQGQRRCLSGAPENRGNLLAGGTIPHRPADVWLAVSCDGCTEEFHAHARSNGRSNARSNGRGLEDALILVLMQRICVMANSTSTQRKGFGTGLPW